MPDIRARRPRSGSRLRRPLIIAALTGLVVAPLTVTAVATAVSLNTKATAIATLSAAEGVVGDALTLTLDTAEADDVYAAAVSLSFDASRLTFDQDAVTSDFPGMYSIVGEIDGDEGRLDFTLTRLGTSSGATGDFSLGELGFTSSAWGAAEITIDAVTLVDSELGRIEQKPGTTLTFSVPAPPEPTVPPTEPPTPPVPTAPGTPSVISTSGYGTTVTKPSSGTVIAAPQSSAAPTNESAQIVASPATPRPGGTVELTVTGLAANTSHRIELHSDPIVLGTALSDAEGAFTFMATIPQTAPSGEHEIVVLADDAVVATLPITIAETAVSPTQTPTATPSASAAPEIDAEATSTPDAPSGMAWWMWVVIALIVVVIAAVIAVLMTRNSSKEKSE